MSYHQYIRDITIDKTRRYIRKIGSGSYGSVYVYEIGGELYAIKKMKPDSLTAILAEISSLVLLKDESYIIELYEIIYKEDEVQLVLEYGDGGDLHHYRADSNFKKYFKEMSIGVLNCHKNNIINGDIKPSNTILVNNTAKLTDFGLSFTNYCPALLFNKVYSRPYRAPEVLVEDGYDDKADIWALGMSIIQFLNGGYFIYKEDRDDQLRAVLKIDRNYIFDNVKNDNEVLLDLLAHMIVVDKENRYNIYDVLSHPYFNLIYQPLSCEDKLKNREIVPFLRDKNKNRRDDIEAIEHLSSETFFIAITLYDRLKDADMDSCVLIANEITQKQYMKIKNMDLIYQTLIDLDSIINTSNGYDFLLLYDPENGDALDILKEAYKTTLPFLYSPSCLAEYSIKMANDEKVPSYFSRKLK